MKKKVEYVCPYCDYLNVAVVRDVGKDEVYIKDKDMILCVCTKCKREVEVEISVRSYHTE